MAIQKLRDGSEGIIAKVIVGLIIIVFALFGMGSITTFLAPTPKVATVGGVDVTTDEMQIAVDRGRRLLMARNQAVDEDTLRADVLQDLIQRTLLVAASDELDLHFGDSAVDQVILQTPAFQVDGAFDSNQFRLMIGNAGFSPLSYRDEMRRDEKIRQMTQGIAATAFLTRPEARRAASLADQVRDLAYLRLPAADLAGEVAVSADEVRGEYDANLAGYSTEETVTLEYVDLRSQDLENGVELTEDEIREAYDSELERYTTPERRQFAHILIETNDDVTEAEALGTITGIAERIAGGEDFAAVATDASQDPGSAAAGGDLGMQGKGTFVEEFEEAAYALELNQVSAPVKTVFGYHLIKLLGMEAEAIPDFEAVRAEVAADLREQRAGDLFAEASDRLATMAFENVPLEDIGAELDLEIRTEANVGRTTPTGVIAEPGVADAAFSDQVLQNSFNSDMISVTPSHNVVLRVVSHQPSEPRPLDDVDAEIRENLAADKARDLAKKRAEELVAMLESGSLTRFVADKYGLEWVRSEQTPRNKLDLDREILEEAFRLQRPAEGDKSVSAVSLTNGDAAVVSMTKVDNAAQDASSNQQLDSISRALAARKGNLDFTEFSSQLESEYEVERY